MVATIDVGTNTALLLVAEMEAGRLRVVHEGERFVRLGEGVDAGGRISEAAMRRLGTALADYRGVAEQFGAEVVAVAGTSASRDAENRAALVDFVRHEIGFDYEILAGHDEARWTFVGARAAFEDLDGVCAMIDIGGGSTEIVGGTAASLTEVYSLDVGSVRLTERCFSALPPAAAEVARAEALVGEALDGAGLRLEPDVPLVGVAGTATSLARLAGDDVEADLAAGRLWLPAEAVRTWRRRLLTLGADAILALDPAVLTGRADILPAGVLILDVVLRRFALAGCRVSPWGLRHGLALRHFGGTIG